MARAKISCLTLTGLLETLSNYYWKHCPITIGHIVQSLLDTFLPILSVFFKCWTNQQSKSCRIGQTNYSCTPDCECYPQNPIKYDMKNIEI
jgi:hypothetical protein